jgi:hypothetical protein
VHNVLTNPIYAGAYAFGRTTSLISVVDGRKHVRRGVHGPTGEWDVGHVSVGQLKVMSAIESLPQAVTVRTVCCGSSVPRVICSVARIRPYSS